MKRIAPQPAAVIHYGNKTLAFYRVTEAVSVPHFDIPVRPGVSGSDCASGPSNGQPADTSVNGAGLASAYPPKVGNGAPSYSWPRHKGCLA